MSPRPRSPRLAIIDGDAVAAHVCHDLLAHEAKLHQLTSRSGNRPAPAVRECPIYVDVVRLVRFAQTGEERHAGEISATLQTLADSYFRGAAWGNAEPLGDQASRGAAASEVATVIIAARARHSIASGAPVDHRGLAALAGVHPSRVHALGAGGRKATLRRDGVGRTGQITSTSARAWLAAQGVPGFAGDAG